MPSDLKAKIKASVVLKLCTSSLFWLLCRLPQFHEHFDGDKKGIVLNIRTPVSLVFLCIHALPLRSNPPYGPCLSLFENTWCQACISSTLASFFVCRELP